MGCAASHQVGLNRGPINLVNLHLVVFGKMGVGKSTFLNAVAREPSQFAKGSGKDAVTQRCTSMSCNLDNITLTLTDVPGFGDPARTDDDTIKELHKHLKKRGNNEVHAMVFVEKYEEKRLAQIQLDFFNKLHVAFGNEFFDVLMIVLTHFKFPDAGSEKQAQQRANQLLDEQAQRWHNTILSCFRRTFDAKFLFALDSESLWRSVVQSQTQSNTAGCYISRANTIVEQRSRMFADEQLTRMKVRLSSRVQTGKVMKLEPSIVQTIIQIQDLPEGVDMIGKRAIKADSLSTGGFIDLNGNTWQIGERVKSFNLHRTTLHTTQHGLEFAVPSGMCVDEKAQLSGYCQVGFCDDNVGTFKAGSGFTLSMDRSGILSSVPLGNTAINKFLDEGGQLLVQYTMPCVNISIEPESGVVTGVTLVAQKRCILHLQAKTAISWDDIVGDLQDRCKSWIPASQQPSTWVVSKVIVATGQCVEHNFTQSQSFLWNKCAVCGYMIVGGQVGFQCTICEHVCCLSCANQKKAPSDASTPPTSAPNDGKPNSPRWEVPETEPLPSLPCPHEDVKKVASYNGHHMVANNVLGLDCANMARLDRSPSQCQSSPTWPVELAKPNGHWRNGRRDQTDFLNRSSEVGLTSFCGYSQHRPRSKR